MITIDFNSFWSDQQDLKKTCIDFVESHAGKPDKIIIVKEDQEDPESSFYVYMNYYNYNINDFDYYDELKDFADEYELYVIVYDHDTKDRKGYWYDEDDKWILQNFGKNDDYANLV